MGYYVDPDIRVAQTLPAGFYQSEEVYAHLLRTAFAGSWQWVGVTDAVPEPGYVYPFTFLEGGLDEPLLLIRDKEGTLRCLSNVCTHRGNLLHTRAGACAALRCRYHGRRFLLNGTLEHAPGFDHAQNFPRPEDHLHSLPLGQLGRMLFTSLRPEVSFLEAFAPVMERVGWLPLHLLRLDSGRSRDYEVKAHWALYCDNYLEGFHIRYVHPSLAAALDTQEYETHIWSRGVLQTGIAAAGQPCFDLPPGHVDAGKRIAAWYFWIFPNLMLNFYPWGLSLNLVHPLGVNRCRVRYLTYVLYPELLEKGAGAGLHRVEMEDEEVVEGVQKGLKSQLYRTGRFSPSEERGVHHFQQMLAQYCQHLP